MTRHDTLIIARLLEQLGRRYHSGQITRWQYIRFVSYVLAEFGSDGRSRPRSNG